MATNSEVPAGLRLSFVIHCWADIAFAVPLFIAPVAVLELAGWQHVDPYTARLTAAALFGIGIESLLGRDAPASSFRAMLTLKVIWSFTAVVGIAWSLYDGLQGRPFFGWLTLGVFVCFHGLWVYWRLRLEREPWGAGAL